MSRGYYAMHRGWMDHEVFGRPIYTKAMAWAYLIENAGWRPYRRDINGKLVTLQRGQLAVSIRFLATKFRWPKSVVHRFLNRLKTETMIETASGTGTTVITICNYDEYQLDDYLDRDSEWDTERDSSGTAAGQQRDKVEEGKEGKTRESKTHSTVGDRSNARGTGLPETWNPSEQDIAFARARGATEERISELADEFRDYWIGVPGARGIKKDWPATWRNRVRQVITNGSGEKPRGGKARAGPGSNLFEGAARAAARVQRGSKISE